MRHYRTATFMKMKLIRQPKSELVRAKSNPPEKAAKSSPVSASNKTVKEHRSEIIGKARKYIYPTQTRRHIVLVSISILLSAVVIFLIVSGVLLYKFQNSSTFIYRVTQVVPFPVAKAGDSYVAYENYLFEVRHYVHYYHYRSQQPVNFSSKSGQDQLNSYKHQALDYVVNLAYAKQLARANNVHVTNQDINSALAVAKNRLGSNEQQFASVLKSFWGWSVADYRRELGQELLMEKVASKLDVAAHQKAQAVLTELKSGASFDSVAKKYSDDSTTSGSGGVIPETVTIKNTDLPPEVVAAAFKLKPGQVSGIIDTGYSLEIIKLLSDKDGSLQLAHVQIDLKPISYFVKPLEAKNPPSYYISLPKS